MLCLLVFSLSYRSQTVPALRRQRQPAQPKAYRKSTCLRLVSLRNRRTEDFATLDTSRLLVACSLASVYEKGFKLQGHGLLIHTSSPCELALIAASAAKERAIGAPQLMSRHPSESDSEALSILDFEIAILSRNADF